MAANKKITELTTLPDSGGAVFIETVRDGANFKLLCNLQATAAPTVTNDSSESYSVGSIWNYEGAVYVCTDASVGAAVWATTATTGSYTPTVTGILNGGTVTFLTDVRYTVINGVVEIKGIFQVELDVASVEEQFDIDLDALIEPTANFGDAYDVIGCIVPITGFTANPGGNVYALTTSKKIQFFVSNDGVGETLKFYFSATYNV